MKEKQKLINKMTLLSSMEFIIKNIEKILFQLVLKMLQIY